MTVLFQSLMPDRDLKPRWPFYEWEFGSLSTVEAVLASSESCEREDHKWKTYTY